MDKTTRKKIQNVHHALGAAVSSINLAKRLLSELEGTGTTSSRDLPGEFGIFDGHFMVTEDGKKYQVNENYASKSKLVYGDQLKRVVQEGEELFKQIERVPRQEVEGVLAKKDGKWCVIDSHGSYEVLSAAVAYFGVGEGGEVRAVIPQKDSHAPFAALLGVVEGKEQKVKTSNKAEREDQAESEKVEKKPVAKVKKVAKKVGETKEKVAVGDELR